MALVASVMALMTSDDAGVYSASKFAVRAIGLTLSPGAARTGVSCTTLHPACVESEIAQAGLTASSTRAARTGAEEAHLDGGKGGSRDGRRDLAAETRHVFTGHGKVGAFLGQHFRESCTSR